MRHFKAKNQRAVNRKMEFPKGLLLRPAILNVAKRCKETHWIEKSKHKVFYAKTATPSPCDVLYVKRAIGDSKSNRPRDYSTSANKKFQNFQFESMLLMSEKSFGPLGFIFFLQNELLKCQR